MNKEEIGKRIKEIRISKGKTMKEFGEMFNPPASDSIVSRWERGISIPNNERLKRIAEIGSIPLDQLLYGNFLKQIHEVLDEFDDGGVYIPYVFNKLTEEKKRFPTEEEIKQVYLDALDEVEKLKDKRVSGLLIGYYAESIERFLLNASEDTTINENKAFQSALKQLSSLKENYEKHFGEQTEDVYKRMS